MHKDINKLVLGPAKYIVICAETSGGKSALALILNNA